MLIGKRIVVVLPAYRAKKTLEMTWREIPKDVVDHVLLVDDASRDGTVEEARRLGITAFEMEQNRGYGGNQKRCYSEALAAGADVVVMVHPDYQYDPRLIAAMAGMVASGVYDLVLGSRILGGSARQSRMPRYKYVANRLLTLWQNIWMGTKLSEFHTGYRAYSAEALRMLPVLANSDDFVFDNQVLAQAAALKLRIGEMSCPSKYFEEASSINFTRSCKYGLGVVGTSVVFRLWKWGLVKPRIFSTDPSLRLGSGGAAAVGVGLPGVGAEHG